MCVSPLGMKMTDVMEHEVKEIIVKRGKNCNYINTPQECCCVALEAKIAMKASDCSLLKWTWHLFTK
jgi:hypothetical protein